MLSQSENLAVAIVPDETEDERAARGKEKQSRIPGHTARMERQPQQVDPFPSLGLPRHRPDSTAVRLVLAPDGLQEWIARVRSVSPARSVPPVGN